MSLLQALPSTGLQVHTDGILPTDAARQIHDSLRAIVGSWASRTTVRLTRLSDPRAVRPIVAQLNLTAPLSPIRAQVAAATTDEAVRRLAVRTHTQLQLLATLSAHSRLRPTTSARSWWPELLRPPADRLLTRTKVCVPDTCTVDAAIRRLEALDLEFHFFRESVSRVDSVLQRTAPATYRLQQCRPTAADLRASTATPVTLVHDPAPVLSTPVAVAQLALTGRPFLLFSDAATRRGRLLYLRYDGDYALVLPAAPHPGRSHPR